MLTDENGHLLVHEIYRFENLSDDLEKLKKRLDITTSSEIPHLESSNRKSNYKDYYCSESIELVRKNFFNDFKILNYSDEL